MSTKLPYQKLKRVYNCVLLKKSFLFAFLLLLFFLASSKMTKAACYCQNPEPDGTNWCRCTAGPPPSATYCTDHTQTNPDGSQDTRTICCDTQYEANTYWSRINAICGTAVETIPYCSYRRGFNPDGTMFFHNDVTCWGTEWSSDPGTPAIPLDTGGTIQGWGQTISYNGFVSNGVVTNIHTCAADLYCCGSTITDPEGNSVSACAGYVPQASSCTPQSLSITPPAWCSNVPSPRDRNWSCQDEDFNEDRNDTRYEFHTYRPYPKEPCNKSASDLALFCGNNLNLTDGFGIEKRFVIDASGIDWNYWYTDNPFCSDPNGCIMPTDDYVCTDNTDGTETCVFTIRDRTVDFWVALDDAYFPIMGNTELVINSESDVDTLTGPQKTNEYVSWYLNGAKLNPVEYGAIDYKTSNDTEAERQIVDFSGPLKKLLSHRNQRDILEAEALDAYDAKFSGGNVRHNQIIGCVKEIVTGDPGKIIACYHTIDNILRTRMAEYFSYAERDRIPPKEEDYPNFLDWYDEYSRWRGRLCVNIFGGPFRFCFNNPFEPDYMGNLYFLMPESSTEDRIGLVDVENANIFPHPNRSQRVVDFRVLNQSVNTDPADLFFAHMQESVELADLLQSTFTAGGERKITSTVNVEPPEWCDVTEVRSNPGDDLFAEQLSGQLIYTSDVSCNYTIPYDPNNPNDPGPPGRLCTAIGGSADCIDPNSLPTGYECRSYGSVDCDTANTGRYCLTNCVSPPNPYDPEFTACLAIGGSCIPNWYSCDPCSPGDPSCINNGPCGDNHKCIRNVTCQDVPLDANITQDCSVAVFASLETQTKTPLADEAWSRLVAGEKGVFQRFYPKIGENTPVKEICDIPASSPVTFTSPWLDSVGNPASGRTNPELYFSHIGGIHQYFLKGIQTALRPQGYGEPQPPYECPTGQSCLPTNPSTNRPVTFGFNVHSLTKESEATIRSILDYLAVSCGTTLVRLWGFESTLGIDGYNNLQKVLDAAPTNVQFVVALEDFNFGPIPHDPNHPEYTAQWYESARLDGSAYHEHVERMLDRYGSDSRILIWELINEPHCVGEHGGDCFNSFMNFARDISSLISSRTSSYVSPGLMGDHFNDSEYYDISHLTNITANSCHYNANTNSPDTCTRMEEIAERAGISYFYVGEAGYRGTSSCSGGGCTNSNCTNCCDESTLLGRSVQVSTDIQNLANDGIDAFLIWQYSPVGNPLLICDEFSVFPGDPICESVSQCDIQNQPSLPPSTPPGGLACEVPNTGYCSPDHIMSSEPNFTLEQAQNAAGICNVESGGSLIAVNRGCLTGRTYDYSVGLFQINMVPIPYYDQGGNLIELREGRCPGAFSTDINNPDATPPHCDVINQAVIDQCVNNYIDLTHAGAYNIQRAYQISSSGTNWCPWSASGPNYCNNCP